MVHLELNNRSLAYGSYQDDDRLDVLGTYSTNDYIPIYSLFNNQQSDGEVVYGIQYNFGYGRRLRKAYSDFFNALRYGKMWYKCGLDGGENIIVTRGAIVDITDNDNPKFLLSICLKKDALSNYISDVTPEGRWNVVSTAVPRVDDFIIFIHHDFMAGTNPVYTKLYKKIYKDLIVPEAFETGYEIRLVSSMNYFVERKFPNFDTLEDRKSFCSILSKFVNGAPKIKFNTIWQTATEVPDTNGNATLSKDALRHWS